MSYQTKFENSESHLLVTVSGVRVEGRQIQDAIEFWGEVSQKCEEYAASLILVVSEITGPLGEWNAFTLSSNLQDLGINREIHIALVDLCAESVEDNRFSETVAVNRGYQVAVFNTIEEGRNWLLQK